jgi:hypothetical protein
MRGMNGTSGKPLAGLDHLRQSIRDILTTPIGTRVMRREYGSELFALVDAPLNRSTIVRIIAATVEALRRWETRIRVTRVTVDSAAAGSVTLTVRGDYLPNGQSVTLDGIVV